MAVLLAFKDTDTSRSLDDTPSLDPDLQVTVTSSTQYSVTAFLILGHAGAGGGDFRFQISNGSGYMTFLGFDGANSYGRGRNVTTATTIFDFETSTTGRGCFVRGELAGMTAGTFGIEWAQSNTNANASILKEGSWIKLVEL